MPNNPSQPEQGGTDPQEIRNTLHLLNQSTFWFKWNTFMAFTSLVVALALLSLPKVLGHYVLSEHLDFTVVRGLFALVLLSNGYILHQQHSFGLLRARLARQLQFAQEQRERADKFYGMAILDPLTGLYNRRYGEECLKNEIARAERNGHDLAVLVMDLDYFKEINDQHGHAAGDEVLKEFSRHLKRAIRACDVPVRIGGDEFLVVLPECPRENVHIILSRLKPFDVIVNRQKITVGYSRGRAQYQVNDTPKTLVQRADEVLYSEKAARSTSSLLASR